jgi:DNA repair exonuclease SbcCD ATPase subunit
MSDTPDTEKAERMAYSQEYMVPTDFARRLERERNELKSIVEQRLVAGATIHQNANDLMRRNERLESERDELLGVIKSLKKNAREDADRIDKLEQALSYGSGGETLLTKFLNAVKARNDFQESAKLLVKQLVLQIEYPAYSVDEVVGKMILMDDAKRFINEV